MKLLSTTVSETAVHLRYGDQSDDPAAWMELHFPRKALKLPNSEGKPLGDPELQFLLEIEAAALLYAREAITAEIGRLRDQRDRAI